MIGSGAASSLTMDDDNSCHSIYIFPDDIKSNYLEEDLFARWIDVSRFRSNSRLFPIYRDYYRQRFCDSINVDGFM